MRMKKFYLAAAAAALITMTASVAAFAEGGTKVDANGVSFEIPAELADLVTVETEGLEDGMLVNVYETASVKAAEAQGEVDEGAGWIFGISRISEHELKNLRCGGMDGMEVFAEDDDVYLIYNHPTDVRFVRESYDDVEEDQKQYASINEWAYENVREEIIANNPRLEPEVYTNTSLDMNLCRALFQHAPYEVRSLEFGGETPAMPAEDDYLEDLAEDFVYQYADEGTEAPDGEYIVLAFDDENVRYDFFLAEGYENYVREVVTSDGEESEYLYLSSGKDAEHAYATTTGVMKAWVKEIMTGYDHDDDDYDRDYDDDYDDDDYDD